MSNSSDVPSIKVWGWTLSVFLLASYLICIGFGLAVPGRFHMVEAPWVRRRGDRQLSLWLVHRRHRGPAV